MLKGCIKNCSLLKLYNKVLMITSPLPRQKNAQIFALFRIYFRALCIHPYICTISAESVYNSLENKLKTTTETMVRTGMFGAEPPLHFAFSTSIVSTSETIRPLSGMTGLKLLTIFFPDGLVSLLS